MKVVAGLVDRDRQHIELVCGDANELGLSSFVPVALAAPLRADDFVVQYTVDADDLSTELLDLLVGVQAELEFYLIDKHEPDPWAYAVYHCSSWANLYSSVHWVYFSGPHAA